MRRRFPLFLALLYVIFAFLSFGGLKIQKKRRTCQSATPFLKKGDYLIMSFISWAPLRKPSVKVMSWAILICSS